MLQNTARQEDFNDSGLTGTVNLCRSIAPEMSSCSSTSSTTHPPLTEPKAVTRAQPATIHSHLLGGTKAAPGSLRSSSELSPMVTKATNNVHDVIHVPTRGMVAGVEPSGTATLIRSPFPR